MYNQFVGKALDLMQSELLRKPTANWAKKLVKVWKALQVMEEHKAHEPYFSRNIAELAGKLKEEGAS